MTNKEAKEKLYMEWQKFLEDNIDYAGISEAYKTAFKALEKEPICPSYGIDCEDCPAYEPKCCDRNICMQNEYNGIGCDECEVTKSQDPCEDAISRETLLRLIRKWVNESPSVEPVRKTGHWIETDSDDSCWYMCSECHRRTDDKSDYCPNCGRAMVYPQESEVTDADSN